jgi:hypothetical protein
MADPPFYPSTPRWLRIFAIAVGAVALLLVVLVHGTSGPRHNIPFIGSLDHSATHAAQESDR